MAASRFQPLRTSARATLWTAGAAALLCAITALTLDGNAATLALVALGMFVACALYSVLGMSRYAVAGAAAVCSTLAIGAGLAFLRLIGLAWDQDPTTVTTVSSRDADPFFIGALAAGTAALSLLLAGALWPEHRVQQKRRRPAAGSAGRHPWRPKSSASRKPSPTAPRTSAVRRVTVASGARVSPSSSRGARRT